MNLQECLLQAIDDTTRNSNTLAVVRLTPAIPDGVEEYTFCRLHLVPDLKSPGIITHLLSPDGIPTAFENFTGEDTSLSGQDSINALILMATQLWDQHYNRVYDDIPDKVFLNAPFEGDERPFKLVPLPVWFYIRGAFFGIGDHIKKRDRPRD